MLKNYNKTLEMFEDYNHNYNTLFSHEALTIDDVLIQPHRGIVSSRKEVENNLGRFIFTAPMDTVTDVNTYLKFIYETDFVMPVLSRTCLDYFITKLKYLSSEDVFESINNGFISIGVSESDFYIFNSFIDNYIDDPRFEGKLHPNVCIDVAHGWSKKPLEIITKLREKYKDRISIMTGSVTTAMGAYELAIAGADYIRIGIGPGKMCSTRLITGVGVPLLHSVADIFNALYSTIEYFENDGNLDYKRKIHLIADGGIKYPGDIAKYLAVGANGVMLGTAFANCVDSPAPFSEDGKKIHRGQASAEFQKEHIGYIRNGVAEGVSRKLEACEPLIEKAEWFLNGLKSTVSYIGGNKLSHINPINCKLIKISNSAYYENKPME